MSELLNQALAEGSISVRATASNWKQAIELAGDALVTSKRTTTQYTEAMVQAFEELGPYMVIAPGIALAHARPSEAVLGTGLSLITLSEPVVFGSEANDPVRLVIGLAAVDHDSHIDLMAALSDLLMDVMKVNMLLQAEN
ncbi:MAG: PTS sugar transporter subunit IIA, partial [Microbacteriaceae bacterium]|nr:PTS sugar transporter subunit IIA [Microbacteriaceae bacterium]